MLDELQKTFISSFVAFAYEDVCKNIFAELCRNGQLAFVPSRIGSYWHNDLNADTEIDVAAVDRQDHIADAAPQRRAPQRRLLAQHAREQDAVEVPAVARLDGLGKGGDDQTAAVPAAVVERAELSGHAQGRALCNVDALQQSGGGKDERQVALP